jgi:putative endonuclease
MAQTPRQRLGRWGETVAALFLEQRGYHIVARNVRTGHDEIDLIARQQQGGILVFVEVKTRGNTRFGLPEEAVDVRKVGHVFRAAEVYLQEHPEMIESDWRIDIIAVQGKPGEKVEDVIIEHFENITA